jgi:hypothetical protein
MRSTLSSVFGFDGFHEFPDLIVGFGDIGLWFIGTGLAWRLRGFLILTGTALSL